jgi:hypothetical protein
LLLVPILVGCSRDPEGDSASQIFSAVTAADGGPVPCNPTVVEPAVVVVSAAARLEAASLVQPPGIVGPSGFDWPDTPLGVIASTDGSYVFLGVTAAATRTAT